VERTKGMMKLTARAAFLTGKVRLPSGYRVEMDADLLELRRADGSLVAAFSARGAVPAAVLRTAEEDQRTRGRSSA
jgi:hypothetical protein